MESMFDFVAARVEHDGKKITREVWNDLPSSVRGQLYNRAYQRFTRETKPSQTNTSNLIGSSVSGQNEVAPTQAPLSAPPPQTSATSSESKKEEVPKTPQKQKKSVKSSPPPAGKPIREHLNIHHIMESGMGNTARLIQAIINGDSTLSKSY